jgi:hypothetical protein
VAAGGVAVASKVICARVPINRLDPRGESPRPPLNPARIVLLAFREEDGALSVPQLLE